MKQEPVAWIYQDPDDLRPALRFNGYFEYKAMTAVNPDIPLYTSPQYRELNDDEIEEMGEDLLWVDRDVNGCGMVIGIKEFARAILRKAQS